MKEIYLCDWNHTNFTYRKRYLPTNMIHLFAYLFVVFVVLNSTIASRVGDDTTVTRGEALINWTRSNGGTVEGIQWPMYFANNTQKGVGLDSSASSSSSSSLIVRIPFFLTLSHLKGLSTFLKPVISSVSTFQGTVLFLIYEKQKGKKSFWYPYFQILPDEYDTTANWTQTELEYLEDEILSIQSKSRASFISADYQKLKDSIILYQIHDFISFDLDMYRWAWFTVGTRSFNVDNYSDFVLIPIVDWFNHGGNDQSNVEWSNSKWYVYVHTNGMEQDRKQLLLNYGDEYDLNPYSMLHYGFARPYEGPSPGFREYRDFILIPPFMVDDWEFVRYLKRMFGWSSGKPLRLNYLVNGAALIQAYRIISIPIWKIWYYPMTAAWDSIMVAAQSCERDLGKMTKTLPSEYYTPANAKEETHPMPLQHRLDMARVYRIGRKVIMERNRQFCLDVMEEILPCIPKHAASNPKILKRLNDASIQSFYELI